MGEADELDPGAGDLGVVEVFATQVDARAQELHGVATAMRRALADIDEDVLAGQAATAWRALRGQVIDEVAGRAEGLDEVHTAARAYRERVAALARDASVWQEQYHGAVERQDVLQFAPERLLGVALDAIGMSTQLGEAQQRACGEIAPGAND